MQAFSGTIKVKADGVISTVPPLINTIFYKGENSMTAHSVSKICSVEGCSAKHTARGYCNRHYTVFKQTGQLKSVERLSPSNSAPFWHRVRLTANPNKCWIWQGCLNASGYGVVSFQNRPTRSHHVAYFFKYGVWPKYLRHVCDTPACVNPIHLIDGTHQENMQDAVERGRMAKGGNLPQSKLNENQVREIRKLHADGYTMKAIGNVFDITQGAVHAIVHRRNWRHVD